MGHGDKEIFSQEDMIKLFTIKNIGKSSSRLDIEKLQSVNNHYIKNSSDKDLLKVIKKSQSNIDKKTEDSILKILPDLKKSAKRTDDLLSGINFIFLSKPIQLSEDLKKIITPEAKVILNKIKKNLLALESWDSNNIEQLLKDFSISEELKFKDIAQPLRVVLTGSLSSPSIYNILDCLGADEVINRLNDIKL